ncbi:MAG: flagellar motor protein MotB [Bacillota bacterium]
MSRRKSEEEAHGGSERWLLTYADMITLLMIFFIVMYTISNVNAQKFRTLAKSLNVAMTGGSGLLDGGVAVDLPEIPDTGNTENQQEHNAYSAVAAELNKYLEENNLDQYVAISVEERGLVVSFEDTILFPKASSDITPQAREIIRRVGNILRQMPNYIRVEGHTDNLPIDNARFKSNWELSVLRATSVVHILVKETGVNPERISATGYGENRPIAPNDSEQNYAKNRRVDIVLLQTALSISEPENLEKDGEKEVKE